VALPPPPPLNNDNSLRVVSLLLLSFIGCAVTLDLVHDVLTT
jgi:hypothetical protein